MSRRVLIAGGTGFIGHHIARELIERDEEVRILARAGSDRSLVDSMPVDIVDGDLEHPGDLERALEGCDALVHAAAYYPVYSLGADRQRYQALGQIGRIHEALGRTGVRRFLYVSTLTAVGKYPDGRPEDENAPFPQERYKSTYAKVKRAMQDAVLSQAERFNTVVVAPTGVLGEGDRKPTTGRLLLDIAKGKVPVAVRGRTNVVDVRSVAWGAAEALDKGRRGRLYVLGGENMTVPGMMARIARIAGVRTPIIALPTEPLVPVAWTTEVLGKILGRPKPLFPVVGLDFARFGEYMSSEVARRELGYEPSVPVDRAIRRAILWFRENGYMD